jgi:dTDP-4-dehydrorhamnose 3,5-epimerase
VKFVETSVPGAFIIEPELVHDDRGWFARTFDAREFAVRGLEAAVVQCNTSFNERAGTLRGLHYQAEPHGEPKLIRCSRGAIFDVGVDLRPDSAAYGKWIGVELSAENATLMYLPRGVAHGFQTLVDGCEVLYQMGAEYVPAAGAGVRWDDRAFAIHWPDAPGGRTISERDRSYPDFTP